jgi:prolipoprotein diacylglyceryltransferase
MRAMLFASIPSPSSANVGPFHMYGILLALGVLVACYVAERRWRSRGYEAGDLYDIVFWVVVWGVIGARLYHVITDYQLFEDDPWRVPDLAWRPVDLGGRRRCDRRDRHHQAAPHAHVVVMDCMAVGAVLAQAIGRWGNYFNQELFGKRPTCPGARDLIRTSAARVRSTRRSIRRSSTSRSPASRSPASSCSQSATRT